MVLNASLLRNKAFLTSAMFARKVDPSVYPDVLEIWDAWFEAHAINRYPL